MTPAEYRAALESLELGVNEFARMCGVDERRARRWASDGDDGPSPVAAGFLRYMVKAELHLYANQSEWAGERIAEFRKATRGL